MIINYKKSDNKKVIYNSFIVVNDSRKSGGQCQELHGTNDKFTKVEIMQRIDNAIANGFIEVGRIST